MTHHRNPCSGRPGVRPDGQRTLRRGAGGVHRGAAGESRAGCDQLAGTLDDLMRGGLHLEVFDFGGAETLAEEAREIESLRAVQLIPLVSGGIDLIFNFVRRGDISRAEDLVSDVAAGVTRGQGAHGWLWHAALHPGPGRARPGRAATMSTRCSTPRRSSPVAGRWAGSSTRWRACRCVAQALMGRGQHGRGAGIACGPAVARARRTADPLMFLRPASALLAVDGNDALLAEARTTVVRIAEALPQTELRRCFLEAEPVRAVMPPTGWDQDAGARS